MMTCNEARPKLQALIDGELDAAQARDVEAHVESCARCAVELAQLRAMKNAFAKADLGFRAPASLRANIEAAMPSADVRVLPSRRRLLQGFAVGGALSAMAASAAVVMVLRGTDDQRLLAYTVAAHRRSLQGDRLTDVASADESTVKPWFNGKLKAPPPVADLSAIGFTLVGGRVDQIEGAPAAAIIYRRGSNVINLFVMPAANMDHTAATGEALQGLNTQRWSDRGLQFIAVSDLGNDDLHAFHTQFEAAFRAGA